MRKLLGAIVVSLVLAACSSGPSPTDQGFATTICKEQIACGYQKTDQASCESLLLQRLDATRLQACNDCIAKEACATEQKTCEMNCT